MPLDLESGPAGDGGVNCRAWRIRWRDCATERTATPPRFREAQAGRSGRRYRAWSMSIDVDGGKVSGERGRRLKPLLVVLVSAVGTGLLCLFTYSLSFFIPVSVAASVTDSVFLAVTVPNVWIPLMVAILVRRPWQARWIAAGVMSFNVAFIVSICIHAGWSSLG